MLVEPYLSSPYPIMMGINQDKYFFNNKPEFQNFDNFYYDLDSKTIIMRKHDLN